MICPAKNKAELKRNLDAGCYIFKPTAYTDERFFSTAVLPGSFKDEPVCLDPKTRRRFAQITKLPSGTWRVK